MKRHPEVKWSEVARRAILEYLARLEGEISSEKLLEELGDEYAKSLDEIEFEKAVEHYKRMRKASWGRLSTILTS